MKQPVLIVGAGPVGLSLALELSRHQVPVRIIDKEASRHQENRALTLHSATLELFQKLGIIDRVLEKGRKIYHYKIYLENEEALDLDFSKLVVPYPFICILAQNETEDILIDELVKYDVVIERKTKLLDYKIHAESVEAHVLNDRGEEESISTPYIMGCDGAKSVVRKKMGTEFTRIGNPHHFMMADAVVFWNYKPDACRSILHEDGPITTIPIRDNHYRIICDLKENKAGYEISPSFFREWIKKRIPGHIEVEDIAWIGDYKRSYREAEKFRNGRVFLVGDAAHVQSPIDGQGMNLGVQDAFNVAWKIAYVMNGYAKKELLKSYSRERKPTIKRIIKNTNRLLNLAHPDSTLKEGYRDFILRYYQKVPVLKQMVTYDLSGIATNYGKSPIIQFERRRLFFLPAIKAGGRFFDGKLLNPNTQNEIRVRSLTQGPHHQLFLFIRKKHEMKALQLKNELNEIYSKILGVHIISSDDDLELEHYWIDPNKIMASPFHLGYPFMILVRPDQHIGLSTRRLSKKKVASYFEDQLQVFL